MDIKTYILAMGYIGLVSDSCMHLRGNYAAGTLVIIVLYVVDMGIAAQHQKILINVSIKFKKFLHQAEYERLRRAKEVIKDAN